jgi:hypothetical protein
MEVACSSERAYSDSQADPFGGQEI